MDDQRPRHQSWPDNFTAVTRPALTTPRQFPQLPLPFSFPAPRQLTPTSGHGLERAASSHLRIESPNAHWASPRLPLLPPSLLLGRASCQGLRTSSVRQLHTTGGTGKQRYLLPPISPPPRPFPHLDDDLPLQFLGARKAQSAPLKLPRQEQVCEEEGQGEEAARRRAGE